MCVLNICANVCVSIELTHASHHPSFKGVKQDIHKLSKVRNFNFTTFESSQNFVETNRFLFVVLHNGVDFYIQVVDHTIC